uniref:glucose oxidase n=1 Tax=Aspergillus bisporus TaxID=41753 RepID=A0A387JU71_9EURO|nr:FAD-dependent glucose dehydrogenase [Aspergillus bisporus]BBE38581.1 FAD-dependent glucose dehydrogenase [synthetic construct]
MIRVFAFLSAFSAALAAPVASSAAVKYDYVIVGGGTSGLVIANRLSENENVSVLVIEAGDSVLNNVNVTDVNGYGRAFGTAIDWQYESVPQIYGGNSTQVLRAAKALGGTSTINGMSFTRAEDVQIDAWETIGNDGLTWNNLWPYYMKSENFTIPTEQQQLAGAAYNPEYHSETGPVKIAFSNFPPSNVTTFVNETMQSFGVPWSPDVNGGKMRGFSVFPLTLDYENYVRDDAARAYYWPFEARPNLHVLLNTFAYRIVWTGAVSNGQVTASGVEVTFANGTVGVVGANQEVIVSAGALKTPGILELSGIGNPPILADNNIAVQVNLPTVGENLQDQITSTMGASGFEDITGAKTVVYANVHDIFGDDAESFAKSVANNIPQYAKQIATVSGNTMTAKNLQTLFNVQYDLIFNQNISIAEILYIPTGTKALNSLYWGLLPFARGNVHISSSDPKAMPVINPNYFMFDWDTDSQVAIAKYIRKSWETAPLKTLIQDETLPGYGAVPQGASDDEWKQWLISTYRSNFHPVGTAAMMPREIGGVVDVNHTVYGTTNVRVVDASVLPFQVCGHLVSTLYAEAERVADLIKASSPLY